MDNKAKQQLGQIMVEQDKLLAILSSNPSALDDYPELQRHVSDKNSNAIAYRRALRNKQFSKEQYRAAVLARIDDISFEMCAQLDLDFLINRVANKVGDDIEAIRCLSIRDFGVDTLSKLLHMLGNAAYGGQETKVSYPWMSLKGQANPTFWKKAHKAFDLMQEGYSTHWKLNSVFKDKFGIAVPQSFPRFVRAYGNPRDIAEWRDWAEYKEKN